MASKKKLLLTALLFVITAGAFAQLGGVHNYLDSSYIPARRMAQQNEWRNNNKGQNFPAKPRDMWQLGITGGLFMVDGDCPALPGWNIGVSVRKSLGYALSLRGSLTYGEAKGLDYRKNGNLDNNDALQFYRPLYYGGTKPNDGSQSWYIANFKTTEINPSLDVLLSLNNIMFHSKENKLNVYIGAGWSPTIYKTSLDLKNASGNFYNYQSLLASNPGFFARKRKDIRSDLKNFFDGNYETDAIVNDRTQNFGNAGNGKYNFRHGFNNMLGVEYRLSPKISLGWEMKYTWTHDDYIDGWSRGGEGYTPNPGSNNQIALWNPSELTPDKDNTIHTNLSLNINLGDPKTHVAPLWWLNPLDYLYGETKSIVHPPVNPPLPDADGDGVTDQFDVEPNTPAGCPVDSHGKSRDTDGDGVPDCRDKELITPTACQPVNADGVGHCPDPECCKPKPPELQGCQLKDLAPVGFMSGTSLNGNGNAKSTLDGIADKMKANPECKITLVGHGTSKTHGVPTGSLRADAAQKYLIESKGISPDRIMTNFVKDGDEKTVDVSVQ